MMGLFCLCILSVCQQQAPKATQSRRPNIVFIFSDDHAYQAMGAYGNKLAQTPNIDRLAREGVLFKNTFITNSICGPSRAILLTGKYSHINGYTVNERQFNPNQFVFPELMQQHGYQTAWVGKMHLGAIPNGFNYLNILPGQGHYYNPDFLNANRDTTRIEGYVTDIITNLSVDWLNNRDTTKPFFLVVGQKATHREWLPALEDLGAYDTVNFPLPETFYDNYEGREAAARQDMTIDKTMRLDVDLKVHMDYSKAWGGYNRLSPEQKKIFAGYYEGVVSKEFDEKKLSGKALVEWKYQRYMRDYLSTAKSLDRNIGRILAHLDSTGLAKNTIVIYASDQGFYMGEHGWFDKRFMYEQSLRTAFMLRYPGVTKAGSSVDDFVIGQDWSATILDAAGIPIPEEIQGKSVLPLIKGEKNNWRKEVYYHYYEFPQPHHVYPHFGIRTAKYKLIRFYGGIDIWELFDLEQDPDELKNIYEANKDKKLISELKSSLEKLAQQYQDTAALRILTQ